MLMEKGRKGKRILAEQGCLLTSVYILDDTAPRCTPKTK